MPRRYVIALIKHETNTFSPIATPLSSFGHGNGPAFGDAARARFTDTNTPMAAYLDLATEEGAEIVTPVAAEAEIVRRLRRIAPELPIAVTLDYHTNLSGDLVDNATVITGYKTYPHVDMYDVGRLCGEILIRKLNREMETSGKVLAATLLPSFPHADTPYTGVSAIVVGDAKRGGGEAVAREVCERMLDIAWQRRAEYAFVAAPLAESVAAAKRLGNAPQDGPVLLIDHCDNCGSGGAQDVMAVVAEILRQELDDVAIAPIRDPAAVAQMIAAGVGNRVALDLGGKTDMPSIGVKGKPLSISGRVLAITDGEFTITGPMYTGIRTFLGRTAVLGVENADRSARPRVEIAVTERGHEPMDIGIFTHCGIDPRQKRFIMLKSRIHYRAGFGPISSHVVECAGVGVTNADLSVYRYQKLKRPIYPLDQ